MLNSKELSEFVHDLYENLPGSVLKALKALDTQENCGDTLCASKKTKRSGGDKNKMESDRLADTIAEELLQLTGAALLAKDFAAFKSHFELPLRLETVEGHRFVRTDDEFSEVFEAVIRHLKNTAVEDFVRTVIYADFVDDDTIRSVHLCSEIHEGGDLKRPAYPVHSTLVRSADRWKIVSCLYVILDNEDHNRALVRVPHDSLADNKVS